MFRNIKRFLNCLAEKSLCEREKLTPRPTILDLYLDGADSATATQSSFQARDGTGRLHT